MPFQLLAFALIFSFFSLALFCESIALFDDLKQVEEINKSLQDRLPFFYNANVMGGYFNMPSAKMNPMGYFAIGGGRITPYNNYGINYQFFDRLELSLNYRIFTGITESNFGNMGFGDDAERIGNFKFGLLTQEDGIGFLPSVSVGADDFLGTKRFQAEYIVATKEWLDLNLELSFGWGKKRLKGPFGGIAYTPWRKSHLPFLKNLSLLLEYDANDYKHHIHEHPKARKVNSRINAGASFIGWDTLQVTVNSVRGKELSAFASLRYPLGTSSGFFSKTENPIQYTSPVDFEPLGLRRNDKAFAQELAYALKDQGLTLFQVFVVEKEAWIKIVNSRYREPQMVRERIQSVLAHLLPENIDAVTVLIEADALPCYSYRFKRSKLKGFLDHSIAASEMELLSPMEEAILPPKTKACFHREKAVSTFVLRPRILTFFGSTTGKFKYNLSLIATPEGYLFDEVYYKIQMRQTIKSSMQTLSNVDRLNPSHLPNVRTDTIKYLQSDITALEMAYLQKGFNHKKGLFSRVALGYFEPAYGGIAAEMLYFPIKQNWAFGVEAATVWKRRYTGLGFTGKIREYDGDIAHFIPFIGVQYFIDFYYLFKPLMLDFKWNIGQFLAKDKGIRTEVGRTFPGGMRFALWYTITNGHDKVNGHTYYDKGFIFSIPLDFFLKKSSRSYMGYAMSAWLRDVGAQAETGKKLWTTLFEERY